MDWLQTAWDFLSNLDRHITDLAGSNPPLFYGMYAASIFAETGFVVTPFVPSETLIFAVGVVAAGNAAVDPWLAGAVALVATLLGDFSGMMLGRLLGRRWLLGRPGKLLGERSVRWAERYFERYGSRTVLISRFLPLVRTAVPFLAGTGEMRMRTFLAFNATGAVLWTAVFVAGGYFFGQIPFVEEHFLAIVLGLGVIVTAPILFQAWHHRKLDAEEAGGEADRAE